MLFQLQEILICHIVRAASEFFRVRQGSPLFFAEACVIALLQVAPVVWGQASAIGRSYMMLGAIMAAVDQRNAEIDKFIQLAVERAPHAGIKAEKLLEHFRAVRQLFLRIAALAAPRAIVNLFDFRIGLSSLNDLVG